jgi:putative flippase GtrA
MSSGAEVTAEDSRRNVMNALPAVTKLIRLVPRPLRFVSVGAAGLATDMGAFSLATSLWPHPLPVRLLSLTLATLVTWRLNRAFTFKRSFRPPAEEALRYVVVTAATQGTSYTIFAVLILTTHLQAQVALLIGAAVGAVVSYNGHRLFAFAPVAPARFPAEGIQHS